MYRLAFITVLGVLSCGVYCGKSPHYQLVAVIPHGRSPPLVDLTDPQQSPHLVQNDMAASSSQLYHNFEDYDDIRHKRESDEDHPDAYLKPPAEDASTPLWQDGNNWDLGYDPSEILSPPMPLSLGIPYDTIKLSSEEVKIPDVNEAQASTPFRQDARPNKPRSQKPRPYKKRPSQSFSGGSSRFSDYEDRPVNKRPSRYSDYEDPSFGPSKRQTFRGDYQENYNDFNEPSKRPQSSYSFAQTDQTGHYKWGVRHHQ